jgi:four helix bundle protein
MNTTDMFFNAAMEPESRIFDLEERLIVFSLVIIEIAELIPSDFIGKHVAGQLLRSGTSPALNYGEAQVAESRSDFIHKMKICLKELKETSINLQIIKRKPLIKDSPKVIAVISECDQLLLIFAKSIETAKMNNQNAKK